MPENFKRQITYKLDLELAERLDEVASSRGISCHEAARSLMITALMSESKSALPIRAERKPPDLMTAILSDVMARLQRIEQAVTFNEDKVTPLIEEALANEVALLRAARIGAREAAHVRTRHLPALRKDIHTAVFALLCKGADGEEPAKVAEWINQHLNIPVSFLDESDA